MPELMVSFAVLLGITIFLAETMSQSSLAVDQGTKKMSMQQATRIAVDRISPLVSAAVAIDGIPAFDRPAPAASSDDRIIFTTTENFLDPNYDPAAPYNFTGATPYTFAITRDAAANELILQRWDRVANAADTSVAPRRLATRIYGFETVWLYSHSIEVRVTSAEDIRRADGSTERGTEADIETARYTQTSVIQVPTEAPF